MLMGMPTAPYRLSLRRAGARRMREATTGCAKGRPHYKVRVERNTSDVVLINTSWHPLPDDLSCSGRPHKNTETLYPFDQLQTLRIASLLISITLLH